jgi:signal transduction histidine kinase
MLKLGITCAALVLGAIIYLYMLDERPSVKVARAMVEDAIKCIDEVGPERIIQDINSGKSNHWGRGALYVFMYQVEPRGYMVAHAVNQDLVNKNLYELTDPDGKLFVKEYLDAAIEKGYSEIPFRWPNPETNKIENKIGVCRLTKDKKYVVCSGAYSK